MVADTYRVELVINAGTATERRQVFRAVEETADRVKTAEVYREHYKEAMNSFRYFGTLRAQIAWLPAMIALAAATYFGKSYAFDLYVGGINIPLSFIGLLFILLLIFVANYYLQKQQENCTMVAKTFQEKWLEPPEMQDDAPPKSYHQILKEEKEVRKILTPAQKKQPENEKYHSRQLFDPSSIHLMVFFFALLATQFVIVSYGTPSENTVNPSAQEKALQGSPPE